MDYAVVAKEISYRYPDGSLGVERVNLKIDRGEKVAIIGENGSGKSTLIFLLSALLKPSEGEVNVLGFTTREIEEIRKRVGVVFQNPDDFLFNPTVRDELLYVPRQLGMSREEMDYILREFSELFGLKEILHKPPFRLSGGEKKKVEIASVLVYKPEIIFFDEPTANVDAKTRKIVKELIKCYQGTVIVATHEMDVAKICERVLIMKRGKIIADSNFKSIDDRILEIAGLI
ncbi:MAG: ABC transporter ATP-binding protein [Archaeoglobaceae archaeon]|nr:energy-coupling factor ABC transporter ATP-binding protein [Archaeoglobaceae archaeon]MDW7990067.1 ABC transporter ATP-binding protein [Archaeoglobaceae archaeon]